MSDRPVSEEPDVPRDARFKNHYRTVGREGTIPGLHHQTSLVTWRAVFLLCFLSSTCRTKEGRCPLPQGYCFQGHTEGLCPAAVTRRPGAGVAQPACSTPPALPDFLLLKGRGKPTALLSIISFKLKQKS